MDFEQSVTLAALVCNIFVVATGFYVIRNTIKRFRFSNVFDFWMKDISLEHQQHYTSVRNLIQENISGDELVTRIETNEETKVSVLYVINHWTVLATGIRNEMFDRQQALWMNYAQVIYFFEGLRPWLCYRRGLTDEDTIFHDFGWLYLESKKNKDSLVREWVQNEVQAQFSCK